MTGMFKTALRFALVALLLAAGTSHAQAQVNAWWHGVLSEFWDEGSLDHPSNWYHLPPAQGDPRQTPVRTASFGAGAVTTEITIRNPDTLIRTMHFVAGVERYVFTISGQLGVSVSILNQAMTTPYFRVTGRDARLFFTGSSRLLPNAGSVVAETQARSRSRVRFQGASRAGNAKLTAVAQAQINFEDRSNAEVASLRAGRAQGRINFTGRSTPSDARIRVDRGG
ncbi:MAG: hypothetical protein ACK4NW_05710, partial [Roseinatronobacter sp.]